MLVYAAPPPSRGGVPVVLRRLLHRLDGLALEVVTDRRVRRLVREDPGGALAARYSYTPRLAGPLTAVRSIRELFAVLNVLLAVLAGVRAALAGRRAESRWVMSVLDGGFSQIAGALTARLLGIPHVVMVFDLWSESAYGPFERWLGRRLEGRLLRGAGAVLVYCEEAAEHLRVRHGVDCRVIATPADPAVAQLPTPSLEPRNEGEIVLAGAVYWMQAEAVERLLRVRRRIPDARVTFIGDEGWLRNRGLEADGVEPPLPTEAFIRRLMRAHTLFIGLSLISDHPEQVRISTPARLVDYMASMRPIVVHAPTGSYLSEYARRAGFGVVVDTPDDDALAEALSSVLADAGRAEGLGET